MRFRSVDTNNDWNFGNGTQAYATDLQALMLNLKTRILSWIGDCFFDQGAHVDWMNLLEYSKRPQLINAIKAVAFRTAGVLRVYNIAVDVTGRTANVSFSVDTIYGRNIQNSLQLAIGT